MWETVRLGDVCTVRRGETITRREAVEGAVPVVGGGTKPTYFHNQPNREANCITISGSGAYAGFVNKWDVPIFASDCSTVEPKDETQIAKFVYYFLISQQQFIYDNFRSGSAQPHVYAKDVANIDYPILSTIEQKRIVERLDKAFAEIDKGVDRHSKSAHLVDKLFSKLIVNFLSDAQGTRTTTIGDISDMQSGYAFKSKDYSDDSEDVRLLRGDNIAAGSVDLTSSKRLPASIAKNYGKFELMAGDLVLAMDRPYISSGLRLARIHQQHLPCLLVQRVMRLRASPDISSDYLQLVMETPEFLEHILGRQTGLGVPHISGKTIGTFPLELPDLARQSQIVQQFIAAKDGASKLLNARRECIAEAKKLKAAILKRELTPSEAV